MNSISFNGGHSFSMKNGPSDLVKLPLLSNTVALTPPRIIGFKAKVHVKVGEKVSLGQVLFCSKKNNNLKFTSPASGVISGILYGPKRSLKAVEIDIADKKNSSYIKFSKGNIEQLSSNRIIENLINSGIWSKLKVFPGFDFIGELDTFSSKERNLFVSLFSTEPHVSEVKALLSDSKYSKIFVNGLRVCSKIFKRINLFNNNGEMPDKLNEKLGDIENVFLKNISDKYPADNPGLQCFVTNSVKAENINVYTRAFVIMEIGYLFLNGNVMQERFVSVAGNGINSRKNIIFSAGQPIRKLLDGMIDESTDYRIISGGLLTGKKISLSEYLSDDDTSIQVVIEDKERILLSFFRLGFNNLTLTKTWITGFFPKASYEISTNNNGEERACIQCGYCYDVCPVDVMPSLLMKAATINDIEKMEFLSIHECVECELCTFICPSKIEIGQHIRNGKEIIKKEG